VESGQLSFPVSSALLVELPIPDYVVLKELELVAPTSAAGGSAAGGSASNHMDFIASSMLTIKGEYYAKGKDF
jgi:hypothetical protein